MADGWREWYDAYLASDAWRSLRARRVEHDKHRCQGCSSAEHLHVHHLTYERFTRELLDDLVTVCAQCHDYIHAWSKRHPAISLNEATTRVLHQLNGRKAPKRKRAPTPSARTHNGENLTASPEPDAQAAATRELAQLDTERARQAASNSAGYVPRRAGKGYVRTR